MSFLVPFLAGILLGIVLTWGLLSHAHRIVVRPHLRDGQYAPAKRAVIQHLRLNGTVNVLQVERLLDIRRTSAMRYVDQMVRDYILKEQGHRGKDRFYTLT